MMSQRHAYRLVLRCLAVFTGVVAGIVTAKYDRLLPFYGVSTMYNGADPLALAVAVVVSWLLWKVANVASK